MDAKAYWNAIARSVCDHEAGNVRHNWLKSQAITKFMLEYRLDQRKILEIGVGAGINAAALSIACGENFDYQGVDISPVFAASARKFFGLPVKVCELDKMPFPDDSFDYVMAFDVLEHVPVNDRRSLYIELDRVLKPRAKFFINNPLGESLHDPNFDFKWGECDISGACERMGMRIERVQMYTCQPGTRYQFIVLGRGY
jgi:SAM-dependent methyltransferase